MKILNFSRATWAKVLALLLIVAMFGLAAVAQDVSQLQSNSQICTAWDDLGNCINWIPNPRLTGGS